MRKVSLLTVAALIALNGCAIPFMHTSASSSIHSSSDVNPTRNVLQEPATYALKSLDNPTAAHLITVNLARGDQVGFQRES
jgi:uncharacterized protein YceK